MLYVFHYDIASIVLTLAILILFVMRKNYPTRNSGMFLMMIILLLTAGVSDLISCFTISYPERVPLPINYLINITFLLSLCMTNVFYFFYVSSIIRSSKLMRFEKNCGILVAVVVTTLLLTTPFTHWIFYFDENLVYQSGPLKFLLYLIPIAFLLLGLRKFILNAKLLNDFQKVTIIFYSVAVTIAVLIQYLFPRYLIILFVSSVVILMVYLSLENPLDYLFENTYCYNLRAFMSTMETKMENKEDFSVVTFSFTDGEYILKYLGYQNVNLLTKQMIRRLQKDYRQKDVYYIDNYRFAVVVNKRTGVDKTVDNLRKSFEKVVHFDNVSVALKLYFVVLHYPEFVRNTDEVLYAINYYYKKKVQTADGRIITATKEALASRQRENEVLYLIRNAIKNDSFEVYFQPIYEEKTGTFGSAETLVRLYDEELGFISPDEFIPLAEQYGLIMEIGDIILKKVFRFWNEVKPRKYGVKYIDVNLSMIQCVQPGFAEHLKHMMYEYEIPSDCIKYEITESISVPNQAIVHSMMQQMIATGTEFFLDDYGTGFSTATYLIDLPFSVVKVDKSILWQATKNNDAMLILKNIIHMIKDLKKGCLVEGVETEEMETLLRGMECDYYQGYFFSKPLPEKEYIEFLMKNSI